MKINMKEVDGKVVVTLDGEMDTTAAVEVEKVLSPLYSEQDKDIILECAKLEYIGIYCLEWIAHPVVYPEGCQGKWT